jgi:hypothetical protein
VAEDVIDEAAMREFSNFLRERMQIYESGAALAAHMPGLIPEHAVHAAVKRFEGYFPNPPLLRDEIAQCWWRTPPPVRFWRTEGLSPAPDCFEVIANSILWDPVVMQWGCDGHWPLLLA